MTGSGETADGLTFRALGTAVSVLVVDEQAGEAASAILEEELSLVDAACSRFRADSELSQLNRAGGRRIAISQFFANALATALTAAQVTDGDVDPTCGRSLVGIGYDRDYAEVRRDATPLCQPATPAAGWQTVELDPVLCTARVPDGVMLDLGATAKALAADRAASRIAAAVGCGVLVNLGGDISVAGEPPPGGWCVGVIDDLGPDGHANALRRGARVPHAVTIADGGLATSSTTVRAWRRGIAAFHHIVAPGTGLPAESCWRTVSVAAASCVDANTASTASIIRGEQAPAWLNGLRLPARLVRHDGTVVTAGGWPADGRTADGRTADEAPTGRQA
ncbi:MAG TPA: FAD:protein FMN transferase [Streptosporangiaceae bacterium]